jgi:hypothetical protein
MLGRGERSVACRRWATVVISVASVLLFLGGSVLADGLPLGHGQPASTDAVHQDAPVSTGARDLTDGIAWPPSLPSDPLVSTACTVTFGAVFTLLGGCAELSPSEASASLGPSAAVAASNIRTTLYNYLNITAASAANLNATFQELLSYYESRAEAIVPDLLNYSTWNNTIADYVGIYSGLVPSLEGIELAIAEQEYQDWNATVASWNLAFGPSGAYNSVQEGFMADQSGIVSNIVVNGQTLGLTRPWSTWVMPSFLGDTGPGNNTFYMNLVDGGTVIQPDFGNLSENGNFSIDDLNTGGSYYVPKVSYDNWVTDTVPVVSTMDHIGQFDLLKVVCNSGCDYLDTGELYVSGGYVFQNISSPNIDEGVPQLRLFQSGEAYQHYLIPYIGNQVCLGTDTAIPACVGPAVPSVGNITPIGTGAGSVPEDAHALTGFGYNAQALLNDTLLMAHDYWLTLRAITDEGRLNIPADCAIPTPSEAFPVSTDYSNYQLSPNTVEAIYLSYLDAVAREYGTAFTNYATFCGDPGLGFGFNWTASWNLMLNITASLYIANASTPLYLNGTADPTASFSNVASWAEYNVDPTILYPAEYELRIPVGKIVPIPVNNPIIAVLVNDPANLGYGTGVAKPYWGVPTYASLLGNGNYSLVSGAISSTRSGFPVADADALEINSCYLNGVEQSTCNISVTYFDNFTYGNVHSILPPPSPLTGGGLGALGSSCGFSALNQWYDGWAGYIGSAVAVAFSYFGNALGSIPIIGGGLADIVDGLGCILAWIVVILLFSLFVYVAARVCVGIYQGFRGKHTSRGENVS